MNAVEFLDRLRRLPRPLLVGFGVLSVFVVGVVDYATGFEFGCSAFYLVPVLLVGWTLDRNAGLAFCVLAALVWLGVDLATSHPYSHAILPFWNAGVRLVIFAVTVLLLAGFKAQHALARTDALTGLPNRACILELAGLEIERARRHPRPLTFAYIDCDDFKSINDKLGHPEGDALLRRVGGALQMGLRRIDTVARLGGDEFAVLLPETGLAAALGVLAKLQKAVQAQTSRWSVNISIGSVTFLRPPTSVDEMLRLADVLLYEAKREGTGLLKASVV